MNTLMLVLFLRTLFPTVSAAYFPSNVTGDVFSLSHFMFYGSDFYPDFIDNVCYTLVCRLSSSYSNAFQILFTPGNGAADKTVCAPGKSCNNGECVDDASVSLDKCIYGYDEFSIFSTDLWDFINLRGFYQCSAYIELYKTGTDIASMCQNEKNKFGSYCCRECQPYMQVQCVDKSVYCYNSNLYNYCGRNVTNYFTYEIVTGNVSDICPFTCGMCQREPLNCANAGYLCKNGAICIDRVGQFNSWDFIRFKCACPVGFTGALCETIDTSPSCVDTVRSMRWLNASTTTTKKRTTPIIQLNSNSPSFRVDSNNTTSQPFLQYIKSSQVDTLGITGIVLGILSLMVNIILVIVIVKYIKKKRIFNSNGTTRNTTSTADEYMEDIPVYRNPAHRSAALLVRQQIPITINDETYANIETLSE